MLLARLIPTLRLRARVHGFERSMLDHELYEQGSLVRVRCMRGTLFALPLDLLPIAWAATRRLVLNMSTSYLASQGLDPKSYELWANRIEALLRTQALLAAQVRSALGAGQQIRLPAVLNQMCDEGRLLRDRPVAGCPSVERSPDGGDLLRLIRGTIEVGHPHTGQPERRDAQTGLTEHACDHEDPPARM
jgi:Winged helix DNA-binding domain